MRKTIVTCCFAMLLTACVGQGNQNVRQDYGYYEGRGTIERIEASQSNGQASGVGAVGGAILGGLLGNQVGGGSGKTVATVAGVAAGAYAGHQAEKAYSGNTKATVFVRTTDGRLLNYQTDAQNMRVGDRVRISQDKIYPDY